MLVTVYITEKFQTPVKLQGWHPCLVMERQTLNSVTVEVPATHYSSNALHGIPNYKDMIYRRLCGTNVAAGQTFGWKVGGRPFTITVVDVVGEANRFDKMHTELKIIVPRTTCKDKTTDEATLDLVNMIQSSFEDFDAFQTLHIPVAKSILIHGVAGVGKMSLIRRACKELNSVLFEFTIHDLLALSEEMEKPNIYYYNPLHLLVSKALSTMPSLVVIRDLDALELNGPTSTKLLDIIEKEINRIAQSDQVCVVGVARELRSLPEALRNTSIFRQHMTVPIPTLPQRKKIIRSMLQGLDIESTDSLEEFALNISLRTSGYVARDLKMICRNAEFKSMRRQNDLSARLANMSLSKDGTERSFIQWPDFEYALALHKPSQKLEVESTELTRTWSDIGGYNEIKQKMKQTVLVPLLHPESFNRLGVAPPSGLLLYGPSGCGKTALVQALVSESTVNVISIRGPEILSKYLGETEGKIRKLFFTAKRIAPCIIFMDEMDAIGTKRGWDSGGGSNGVNERVLSTLLNEMDGVESRQGVAIIGCTNSPDHIDDALLRPGRLDQLVYVGLPQLEDRAAIIKMFTRKMALAIDVDVEKLAMETEYCSGADLENIFREAGTNALRDDINVDVISNEHLSIAAGKVAQRAKQQSQNEGLLDVYDKFRKAHSLK